MKKLSKLLQSRMFITILLLFVQLVILIVFLGVLFDRFAVYYIISSVVALLSIVDIANSDMNPSFKIAWLVLVLIVPFCGTPLYLIFSKSKQDYRISKRLRKYKTLERLMISNTDENLDEVEDQAPEIARQMKYISKTALAPVYKNTQTKYFAQGEDYFEALLYELRHAQRFIFLEYFIIENGKMFDSILEILKAKVAQGIEVRLMFDDLGTISKLTKNYDKELEAMGLRVSVFNRLRPSLDTSLNYRDHRKIVVIDGNVAFTGGINLADEYINEVEKFGHWKDTGIMLKGDAVTKMTETFLQLWHFSKGESKIDLKDYSCKTSSESDGYIQPFADGPMNNDEICEMCYMGLINSARKNIYITTPYLILDNEMQTALCHAAKSGVDVKIITPHIPDKKLVLAVTRSYYRALLKAGVKIYEYTPGFIHAKSLSADSEVCVVGTANFDFRSFYMHFENCVLAYKSSCVNDVEKDFEQTLELCEEITLESINKKGTLYRLLQAVLKIFAPLM